MKLLRVFVLAILLAAPVFAQSAPQPVQHTLAKLDAATAVATSATSAATLTITPPGGSYVYVTNVEITNCAGTAAVAAAAPLTISTTNLGGIAWTVGVGTNSLAGTCVAGPATGSFAGYLKSAVPGTNVTIVLPTFATNQTLRVSAYYYFGP